MRATFKLINSYFWKTIYGPIIAFIFPIMLLGILGNIMRIEYVYPGIIALTMLFLGVLALPLAIMELKGSSLFKYIGSSPVNPLKFSIVVIAYYIFISILTSFVIMFGTMTIFYKEVFPKDGFKYGLLSGLTTVIGFFSLNVSSLIHLILVISVGLAVATFAKTPQQALTFAIIIIIPSMFLSGMVLTVDIIAKSKAMQWISRFIPFRYSTGNLIVATTPISNLGGIFNKLSIDEKKIIFGDNAGVIVGEKGVNYGFLKIRNLELDKINDLNLKNVLMKDEIKGKWFTKIGDANIYKGNYLKTSKDIQNFILDIQEKNSKISPKIIFNEMLKSRENGDYTLFKHILLSEEALNFSDNNIFQFNQAWSVRKNLEPSQLKKFLIEYFKGGEKTKTNLSPTRFFVLLDQIRDGRFKFMDMFTKQSIGLYAIPERSLNLMIPLVFSSLLWIYINKKFTWTSR